MRTTTKRIILPFLLTLAVLALAAASMYQPAPAGAQSGDALAAPKVTLTGAAACTDNPRTYLATTYTSVDGASSYEYRMKWGRAAKWTGWTPVPDTASPGSPWAPSLRPEHLAQPGEDYAMKVRAVAGDGSKGAAGTARYSHVGGSRAVPTDVAVAYAQDGGNVDYTRARLTWRGEPESGGWFSIQRQTIGEKGWQSGSWRQFSTVAGRTLTYYHDISGLDAQKGYRFRLLGHTASCQPSAWSEIATLWPVPDAPDFLTSVGRDNGDGHQMGVWVEAPYDRVDYHKFRIGGADAEAVKVPLPAAQQHSFPVSIGTSYNVCVAAGSARGESEFACRTVAAQISSPIVNLRLVPSEQMSGSLDVRWELIPVVNPNWDHDPDPNVGPAGTTHDYPWYRVALREAGTGDGQWPNAQTTFKRKFREGQDIVVDLTNLKGNTEYEVAVQTSYYGESGYVKATGRTLMNPVRGLTVGFVEDDPDRAVISWQAPQDSSQEGYVVTLRRPFKNRLVEGKELGAAAVSTNFDGLKKGRWYHVNVKAVGDDDVRSAVRRCYFKHGVADSQNTVATNEKYGTEFSCAATP